MNLLALPVSTSLSDVEKRIVQAFLRNGTGPRRPYADVYRMLAQSLHVRVVEIRAIERAMVARIGASQDAPDADWQPGTLAEVAAERANNGPAPAIALRSAGPGVWLANK